MKPLVLLLAAATGCAGYSRLPPPCPMPPLESSRPAEVLREQSPRRSAGEVVLDDRDGLSPAEAAVLAVDHNPGLRAARAERGIGQAELLAAGILPNPRLDADLSEPIAGEEAKVLGYGAGISWNVTPLLSRGARVSAAREGLASIDLDIGWQEWQVAEAARLHTVRGIYLERRAALARELEQTWQRRLASLRQARAQGAVTELELTNAERSLADARLSRLEVERQIVAERAELGRALGVDPSRELVLDASFHPADATPDLATLLGQLPLRRLDLVALQHANRSRDEARRAAVISRFPPVELGFHAAREVDRNASAGVTLTFELPFFDRNQDAVTRETARRVQVGAEYDARLLEARAGVLRAVKELGIVRDELATAREGARAAERLAEQARAAAVSGALDPLLAADILERSYASRLRALEIEQVAAELDIALALASGVDVP